MNNLINEEKRKVVINEIIIFFKEERDETLGIIAAESILNFFLEDIGKYIYNKGIEDSNSLIKNKLEDLEIELEVLKKS